MFALGQHQVSEFRWKRIRCQESVRNCCIGGRPNSFSIQKQPHFAFYQDTTNQHITTNITSHSSQAKVKYLTECVYKNHDKNVVKNCWAKQILCNKTINKSIKSKKSSNSPSSQFHLYTYVWYTHSGVVYWIPSHIHSTWVPAAIKSMYLRMCLFMYEDI